MGGNVGISIEVKGQEQRRSILLCTSKRKWSGLGLGLERGVGPALICKVLEVGTGSRLDSQQSVLGWDMLRPWRDVHSG